MEEHLTPLLNLSSPMLLIWIVGFLVLITIVYSSMSFVRDLVGGIWVRLNLSESTQIIGIKDCTVDKIIKRVYVKNSKVLIYNVVITVQGLTRETHLHFKYGDGGWDTSKCFQLSPHCPAYDIVHG